MNVIIICLARKWQSTFIFIICGSYEILLYSTMGWKSLWSCNWLFHFQKKFTFTKSTIQNVQRSQSYIIFHLFLGTLQCYVSKSSEDKSICPLIWIGCGEVFAVQCNVPPILSSLFLFGSSGYVQTWQLDILIVQ